MTDDCRRGLAGSVNQSSDQGTVAVAEIARDLAECIGRYMSETDYRSRLLPGAAEFVANRGLAHPSARGNTP